jgi:arylformamidase
VRRQATFLSSFPKLSKSPNDDSLVVRLGGLGKVHRPRTFVRGHLSFSPRPIAAADVRGKAVLIRTDWARHWRTDAYFEGFPHLTGRLAQWLRDAGAVLVGIDSHNIDSTDTGERPVHSTLLGADIPIVEHLCGLDAVPDRGAKFFAVPVKVKGFGTFPVRAFAAIEN